MYTIEIKSGFETLATLAHADRAYRHGSPVMTDAEFDRLAATVQPGTIPAGRAVIGNDNRRGRKKWAHVGYWNDMEKSRELETIAAMLAPCAAYAVQPKIDGVALCLTYKRGKLHHAALRGNDFEGDDVTAHVAAAAGIPATLPTSASVEVRGELYITNTALARCPKAYPTCQSAVASALNHKDATAAHAFPLRFAAYKISPTAGNTGAAALAEIARAFHAVPATIINRDNFISNARAFARGLQSSPIPCDGIIIHDHSGDPLTASALLYAWKF